MTYFREFCYLNSSRIRKSITLMFMISSKDKFTLLYQNSVTDVSVGFRPPCWCPCGWAPAWCLHTNLQNLGKTFLPISRIWNTPLIWILARVFAYLPPQHFPDSGLYLLNGFVFFLTILNGVTLKTINTGSTVSRITNIKKISNKKGRLNHTLTYSLRQK